MARALTFGVKMKFHALRNIAPKEAAGLVGDLMSRLSISSAEELISFATVYAEKVAEIVGNDRKAQWLILYDKAQSVIPPDILETLKAPPDTDPVTGTFFCRPEPRTFGRFKGSHVTKIRR